MKATHIPVMRDEALNYLHLEPGMTVVDATVGAGGHAAKIVQQISPGGRLIGVEWDGDALEVARRRLRDSECRVLLARSNFAELGTVLDDRKIVQVDAVLFDIGVSSLQLEKGERGFSFNQQGPLDMRMDCRREVTAREVLQRNNERQLAQLLKEYGGEMLAKPIARRLAREKVFPGTRELARMITGIYRRYGKREKIHPATRTFQALRIAVNDELNNLSRGLAAAIERTRSGGRIVVISFHSLEDRIVKQVFAGAARACSCPSGYPVCVCGCTPALRVLTRKPLRPKETEVRRNPRARSARLRAAEKIGSYTVTSSQIA